MRTVTLADLMSRARLYADMTNSGFIKDPELIIYINNAARKYYNLINSVDQNYYLKKYLIPVVMNQVEYDLPSDFLYCKGAELSRSTVVYGDGRDKWDSLDTFSLSERNNYTYTGYSSSFLTWNVRYCIVGNTLTLTPNTSSIPSRTIRLLYTPVLPDLAATTDTLDGINGFEDYIARLAAMDMKAREESDLSYLMEQCRQYESDITSQANNRNRDRGDRVSDVNAVNGRYGWW